MRDPRDDARPFLIAPLALAAGTHEPARTHRFRVIWVAMGTGTDVAMSSAEVTLVKGDLRGIARARALSDATVANMKQNLGFAFVYNALGIPLAAGLAMSLSSASVVANALRLRTQRP